MDNTIKIFSAKPTEQLLLLCLQDRVHHDRRDRLIQQVNASDIDWTLFLEYTEGEKVSGLVLQALEGLDGVPGPVLAYLEQAYERNAMRNILMLNELKAIQDHLQSQDVSLLLLKGASLNITLYPEPGLRPLGDLDLLVPKAQFKAAISALKGLGYEIFDPEERPGSRQEYENEIALHKPEHIGTYCEIHWSLLNSPYYQHRLDMEWFWQTSRQVERGKRIFQVLDDRAQLIHLAAHIVLHHSGRELLWLNDIAELVTSLPIDFNWDDLLQRARQYHLLLPIKQTLYTLVDEWALHLPDGVKDQLDMLEPTAEEEKIFSSLNTANRPVARRFVDDLYNLPGWQAKLAFAWANLFPSPAYMRQRYQIRHPLLLPLFYPYRWFLGLKGGL